MKWAVALLCSASGLAADGLPKWPALYDVTNVAATDVLNVRAQPNAEAEILGTFAFDAKDVEVISIEVDGRWGQVNTGERAGWVRMSFLEPQSVPDQTRPQSIICFGTEPFWAFTDRVAVGFEFQFPGADPLVFAKRAHGISQNRPNRYFLTGSNG